MQSDALYRVDPPAKGRSPAAVAEEVVHLIRSEYRCHTAGLCALFLCDRQWVDKTFRPEIRHIRITHYFRGYILEHAALSRAEKQHLSQGFYFYSFPALQEYWRTHAVAQRKTRPIDLANYVNGHRVSDLISEVGFHRLEKPCAKEKERHLARMQELLTAEGYRLYLLSLGGAREWVPSPLPVLEHTLRFTNLAQIREREQLHSNAAAMQYLLRRGAVRIKLGSRALWLLPEDSLRVPVAIPADTVL